jgi:hypothetical protein
MVTLLINGKQNKKYGIVGTMAEYHRNRWPSIPLLFIYIEKFEDTKEGHQVHF